MSPTFSISNYIDLAMRHAEYEKLADGTFAAEIPTCIGIVAFGDSLRECQDELRSVLEDWILVGLRFGDEFPVFDGIDINVSKEIESLEPA